MNKKIITTLVILLSFIQINCFGKFAITKKLYVFVDGINLSDGNGLLTKFSKSVVMWVFFRFFVAGIAVLLDICVFNLIEFWTDNNIMEDNNQNNNKKTDSAKSISAGKVITFKGGRGEVSTISKSKDGNELRFKSFDGKETREIIAYKDQPGKLFTIVDNQIQAIEVEINDGEIQRVYSGNINIPLHQN